jgi:UDP-N-acetylmuramoyl-L-alanyl-D-glutamate--2,6-diaminopimelate ligase
MINIIIKIKSLVKKFLPTKFLLFYHYLVAILAAFWFGRPAKKMYIVGITGTKGKTSAANFIWSVFNSAGFKTGLIGTANIRIWHTEKMNDMHMTMPSPFKLQKILWDMYNGGCTHVVMEATSEGMKLWRHIGIDFDCAIFTNLTPEHLPSHEGSFENYKKVKMRLFKSLAIHKKTLNGMPTEKVIITNADSEHSKYYAGAKADKKLTYGIEKPARFKAENIKEDTNGVSFTCSATNFHISMLGRFNIYNALPAIALGSILNIPTDKIKQGIDELKNIPGRMEVINEGQKFTVIVDYAHEKISMNAVLDTARNMAGKNKVIVLLGAEGGGRDKAKRPAMGEAAGKKADIVICSNVDPYEDDPYPIANDIAVEAERHGKVRDQDLFVILDRREGIKKALSLANINDIVLITGKGAEQTIIIDGKSKPWDDRVVVSEELKKIKT